MIYIRNDDYETTRKWQGMNDIYLVSVIIPVFNVAPYLVEALNSILDQTYKRLEILVIDDGSTDGSDKICDAYRAVDDRIRVVHQENKGLSGARNTGLDMASGDYIAFLDPDDAFAPEMIQTMLDALAREDADVAVCGFVTYKSEHRLNPSIKGRVFRYERQTLGSKEALVYMLEGKLGHTVWDKIYKRELWNNIRFPEGHVYEDQFINHKIISSADRIVTLDEVLVRRRIRKGSISQTISIENVQDRFMACDSWEKYISDRIPEIFTENQLLHLQDVNLRAGIADWAMIRLKDPTAADAIRVKLLEKGKHIQRKELIIRTRIAYQILLLPSLLLPVVLPVYLLVRRIMYIIKGRVRVK